MPEETLMLMNPWWSEEYAAPGIERKIYLEKIEKSIKRNNSAILFGLRRVGKTTIMRQFAARKIPEFGRKNIVFASMDHPEIEKTSIIDILREFRRINRLDRKERVLMLLDEVQHRKSFEREMKAIIDSEPSVYIVASGSSSSVIKQRSAAMTGRYRKIHVKPLSFEEFLIFKGRKFDPYQPQLMEAYMDEYLITGGMPQYVLTSDAEVLTDLVEDVIYKDIAGNYGVKDPRLLKDLFFLLMERVGKPTTYSKLARVLEVGVDTIRRYMGYFEESYMIDMVEIHGTPNVRKRAPRKCYAPDTGIKVVFVGKGSIGALAENMVYLKLRELGDVKYYTGDKGEVNFIYDRSAVEVKYKDVLSEDDVKPIKSLKLKGVKEKLIVTKRELERKDIKTVPLWKFLIEE